MTGAFRTAVSNLTDEVGTLFDEDLLQHAGSAFCSGWKAMPRLNKT